MPPHDSTIQPHPQQPPSLPSHPQQQSDGRLLRDYLDGTVPDALAELIKRHAGFVYAVACRQTRDRHLAEDVTQNVFLVLLRKAPTLRESEELCGWLFTVTMFEARNAQKSRVRESRRIATVAEHQHQQQQSAGQTTAMHEDSFADVEPRLNEALETLADDQRQAIILRYLRQSPYDRVAASLGVSEAAARQRVHRGLEQMRAFFKSQGVVTSATGLAAGMRASGASAAAPPELVAKTLHAVAHFSNGAVTAKVVAVSIKTKLIAAALIVGSFGLAAGTYALVTHSRRTEQTVYIANTTASPAPAGSTAAIPVPRVRSAYEMIDAIGYDENRGTRRVSGFIGFINGGDWLRYKDVDFGSTTGNSMMFSAIVTCPDEFGGNTIEVRQDSLDGPVLARLTVNSTGGYGNWRPIWAPVTTSKPGMHDVFLRFSGGGWNLDTFKFTPATRDAFVPLEAITFNDAHGMQTRARALRDIDDGAWVRYDGLEFGSGVTSLTLLVSCDDAHAGGRVALRLDRLDAPPIAELRVDSTAGGRGFRAQTTTFEPVTGRHAVFLTFAGQSKGIVDVAQLRFGNLMPTTQPTTRPLSTATTE